MIQAVQEILVPQDSKEFQGLKDSQDQQEMMVCQDLQAIMAAPVLKDHKVRREIQDLLEILVHLDKLEFQDLLVPLVLLETRVLQV